jgi:hypothetical protein
LGKKNGLRKPEMFYMMFDCYHLNKAQTWTSSVLPGPGPGRPLPHKMKSMICAIKIVIKLDICSYYWWTWISLTHTIWTDASTVNSLGCCSVRHRTPTAPIPSFNKKCGYKLRNTYRNLSHQIYSCYNQ